MRDKSRQLTNVLIRAAYEAREALKGNPNKAELEYILAILLGSIDGMILWEGDNPLHYKATTDIPGWHPFIPCLNSTITPVAKGFVLPAPPEGVEYYSLPFLGGNPVGFATTDREKVTCPNCIRLGDL